MLAQHRSVRGTFTSKVKDAIHYVFSELPQINTCSSIDDWKKKPVVGKCYSKLFKKVKNEPTTSYMTKIIDRVLRDRRNASKVQIAFTISICETYLDPCNEVVQISEVTMQPRIAKNLVSFKI